MAQGFTRPYYEYSLVNRGDPASEDFTSWTTDGTWRNLDCSSIVPAGARFIHFKVIVTADTPGRIFRLRRNGNTNAINVWEIQTQAANIPNAGEAIVACDTSRIVQYWATSATFSSIIVSVRGWFF